MVGGVLLCTHPHGCSSVGFSNVSIHMAAYQWASLMCPLSLSLLSFLTYSFLLILLWFSGIYLVFVFEKMTWTWKSSRGRERTVLVIFFFLKKQQLFFFFFIYLACTKLLCVVSGSKWCGKKNIFVQQPSFAFLVFWKMVKMKDIPQNYLYDMHS